MSDPFAYARKGPGGSSAASSGMHYSHQAPTAPLTDPFAASGGGGWHNDTGGWGESSIGVSDVAAPQVGSMGRIGGAAPRPTASMPQPQPHYPPSAPHQPQQPHYPSSSPNVAVPAAAPSSSSSGGGLFNPALALAAAATFGAGGGAPGSGSPAELLQNPVAQLAMQKSQELVSSSVAKYLPGAHALWRSLRYYFRVSNSYCRAKLGRILFPFTTKKWARIPASEHDRAAAVASGDFDSFWSPPSKDTNAPDLYLPLMSLATYVLATGLLQGMSMKFHPDLLQTVLSRSFAVLLVEVAVLRFSLYALGVSAGGGGVSSLDLLAFGGYKFVALVINLLTGIFFGRLAYYMVSKLLQEKQEERAGVRCPFCLRFLFPCSFFISFGLLSRRFFLILCSASSTPPSPSSGSPPTPSCRFFGLNCRREATAAAGAFRPRRPASATTWPSAPRLCSASCSGGWEAPPRPRAGRLGLQRRLCSWHQSKQQGRQLLMAGARTKTVDIDIALVCRLPFSLLLSLVAVLDCLRFV